MDDKLSARVYAAEGDIQQMKAWLLRHGDIATLYLEELQHTDALNRSLGHHALTKYNRHDRSDMIRLLVSHGVDVDSRNIYRQSLLHSCKFPEEAAASMRLKLPLKTSRP